MTITVSSGLNAAIAGSTDKIDYVNAAIAVLGVNRTMVCKRSATPGDVFAIGTTFYAATCGGTMRAVAGALTDLGVVTAITTRTNSNFATGYSILRIQGGGEWLQGTLGLPGSGADFIAVRELSGLYSFMPSPNCKILAPAELPSAPDIVLTTMTLRNKSTSLQAAGFVLPLFGHSFVEGQVPAGSWPYFKLASGGQTCPTTLFNVALWPDGSMRFAAVLMRVPTALTGSGTLSVQVRSGGQAPAAGTRTTAEVSALGVSVELNITTPAEGTYKTELANAIANDGDVVLYANGPAGAVWRIGGYVKDSGGVAHSQLYAHHYVLGLTNANGTLRGSRHLCRVLQPFVTAGAQPARSRELTAAVKVGGATVRNMLGHILTETPAATFGLPHYASFTTADVEATYDYFQGTGNTATDCSVHIEHNLQYMMDSRIIPPYAYANTSTTLENEIRDYRPMGRGSMMRYMPSTGGRPDIGLITGWDAKYIANPSPNNLRSLRVQAMCASGWRNALWNRSTRRPVLVSDIRPSYAGLGTIQPTWRYASTNAGFITPSPNVTPWTEDPAHRPQPFLLSYVLTGEPHILDIAIDDAMMFQNSTVPGLLTMSTQRPYTHPAQQPWTPGGRDVRCGTDDPETVKGGGLAYSPGRTGAWMSRQLYVGAALCPATMADGTEINVYLDDVARAGHRALRRYADRMPASHANDGLYIFEAPGGTDVAYESPWQIIFWNMVLCWASAIWQTEDAETARRYFLRKYVRAHEQFDVSMLASYRWSQYDHNENLVTSISQYVGNVNRDLALNGTANTLTFLPNGDPAWHPTNGDLVAFSTQYTHPDVNATFGVRVTYTDGLGNPKSLTSAMTPPVVNLNASADPLVTLAAGNGAAGLPAIVGTLAEGQVLSVDTSKITDENGLGVFNYQWLRGASNIGGNSSTLTTYQLGRANNPFPSLGRNRRLYVVNASGSTFQLALTAGGAPIDIIRSTDVEMFLLQPQNVDAAFWPAPGSDYPTSTHGGLAYHTYLGDPGADEVRAYVRTKLIAWGGNPSLVHQYNFASE